MAGVAEAVGVKQSVEKSLWIARPPSPLEEPCLCSPLWLVVSLLKNAADLSVGLRTLCLLPGGVVDQLDEVDSITSVIRLLTQLDDDGVGNAVDLSHQLHLLAPVLLAY